MYAVGTVLNLIRPFEKNEEFSDYSELKQKQRCVFGRRHGQQNS